jgi:hypothetical protein
VDGSCEHGIEPSGSIKCWGVTESSSRRAQLRKYVSIIFGLLMNLTPSRHLSGETEEDHKNPHTQDNRCTVNLRDRRFDPSKLP